jgi:hypothetical protein
VFAFVSVDGVERELLRSALADLRQAHKRTDRFVFHYVDCPTALANAFFACIASVAFEVRIGTIDKGIDWVGTDKTALRGQDRLRESLAAYSLQLPPHLVEGGQLLIDSSRSERKSGLSIRQTIRHSFRLANRACFRDIRICSDGNDLDGVVIQVADMVAGAVRRAGSADHPHIHRIERRVVDW